METLPPPIKAVPFFLRLAFPLLSVASVASALPITWTEQTITAQSAYHGDPLYDPGSAVAIDSLTNPPDALPLNPSSSGTWSITLLGWQGEGNAGAHAEAGSFSANTSSVGLAQPWSRVIFHGEVTTSGFNVVKINIASWYYHLLGSGEVSGGRFANSSATLIVNVDDLTNSKNLFHHAVTRTGGYHAFPGGEQPITDTESFAWDIPVDLNSAIAIDIVLANTSNGSIKSTGVTASGQTQLEFSVSGGLGIPADATLRVTDISVQDGAGATLVDLAVEVGGGPLPLAELPVLWAGAPSGPWNVAGTIAGDGSTFGGTVEVPDGPGGEPRRTAFLKAEIP